MREGYLYILEGYDNTPIPITDSVKWGKWMERQKGTTRRRVGLTKVGIYWVSTTFLGMDHNIYDEGPPLLFETMIFESENLSAAVRDALNYQERYPTWELAEVGHEEAVAMMEENERIKIREED